MKKISLFIWLLMTSLVLSAAEISLMTATSKGVTKVVSTIDAPDADAPCYVQE